MSHDPTESETIGFSILDAYHSVVGAIASEWASLEFYMDYTIWQLAKVEQKAGVCITSQLNGTASRMRSLIALLRLRNISEDIVKSFKSFEGRIQPLAIDRNRAVHDTWAFDQQN